MKLTFGVDRSESKHGFFSSVFPYFCCSSSFVVFNDFKEKTSMNQLHEEEANNDKKASTSERNKIIIWLSVTHTQHLYLVINC